MNKKFLSILFVVLLLMNICFASIGANALGSLASVNISSQVTWVNGAIVTTDALTYGYSLATNTRGIRTNFIHISRYSKITWSQKGCNIGCSIFYYETNTDTSNSISAPNGRQSTWVPANGSVTVTLPEKAKYIRAQIWNADGTIAVSEAPTVTLTAIPTVGASQIDANKTGSLNIYKYEMSDVSTAKTNGTGYESDKTNVPAGAKGLNGVTFTAKRVANLSSTYYTAAGTALPTVSQAKTMTVLNTYTQTTATVSVNGTDTDGVAQFTNLPLGIYLVQETNSPSHVTKKVDDFIVSIPYTSSDRTSWKYTVDVFPKNETKYANVRIKKVDKENSSTTLQGAKFNVFKSEDNANWTQLSSVTSGSNGTVDVTNLPVNYYYLFSETTPPVSYILDNNNYNHQTYCFLDSDGKILSTDKNTTISSPSGTTPATLTITNSKPTISKYIDASRGNGSDLKITDSLKRYDDDNNYQYYIVRVKTPDIASNLSTLKQFVVIDDFTNINGTKMAPTIHKITYTNGTNVTNANSNVLSTDAYTYTCTQDSTTATTYKTTLTFDTSKLTKNYNYYIYYKCFVKQATTNKAYLKYSTQTTSASTAENTIESNSVRFIVGSCQLKKTNGDNVALQGAQFKLFRTREEAVAGKNPVYASTTSGGATQSYTFTSSASGAVYIYDVDIGSSISASSVSDFSPTKKYWIVETKAPTGYNLLSEPVEVTFSRGGGDSVQATIINSAQYTFPLTGGHGWIMFAIGAVVFFGCGTVLIIKKKKNKKRAIEHES